MKTTLNQIQEKSPSIGTWRKLLTSLGKTKADDDPVTIAQIIDSNGIADALWCLRAVQGRDHEIRLYAVWCARQVQHMMTNPRSLAALNVAERFAIGEETKAELSATWAATWAAQETRLRELCAECESGVNMIEPTDMKSEEL